MKVIWGGGIFVLGMSVVGNVISSLLTTNYTQITETSVAWLISHASLFLGPASISLIALVSLTFGFWLCNRFHKEIKVEEDNQRDRNAILPRLERYYHELLNDLTIEISLQFSEQEGKRTFAVGTALSTLLKERGPSMLLLGVPGGGKSTQLARLAQELVKEAKTDPTSPLPILLKLSDWKKRGSSLEEWVVRELRKQYEVPPRVSWRWLDTDNILLLLDGLDEVQQECQQSCFQAIQAFLVKEKGHILPIVLTSRQDEYEKLPYRLSVGSTIEIQPLSSQDIQQFLRERGLQDVLQTQTLAENTELLHLLHSPLMLSMVAQIGTDTITTTTTTAEKRKRGWLSILFPSRPQLAQPVSQPISQSTLILSYIKYIFQKSKDKSLQDTKAKEQLLTHLSWLAKQMQKRGRTTFSLEDLQGDWLEDIHLHPLKDLQSRYRLFGMILSSCLFGVLLNLFLNNLFGTSDLAYTFIDGALGGVVGWLLVPGSTSQRKLMRESIIIGIAVTIFVACCYLFYLIGPASLTWEQWFFNVVIYGPAFGCGVVLLAWFRTKGWIVDSRQAAQSRPLPWSFLQLNQIPWRCFSNGFFIGLILGGGSVIGDFITNGTPLEDATDILLFALTSALLTFVLAKIVEVIQPVESDMFSLSKFWELLTSFKHMFISIFWGFIVYLFFFITTGLTEDSPGIIYKLQQTSLIYAIQAAVIFWLLFGFYRSLYTKIPKWQQVVPDSSILRSGRMGLIVGSVLGFICWLVAVLASLNQGITTGEEVARTSALVVGIAGGVMFGLAFGGLAYLQHNFLCRLLVQAKVIPTHYKDTLAQATSVGLLRRVGGAYQFYHSLLCDYLAFVTENHEMATILEAI